MRTKAALACAGALGVLVGDASAQVVTWFWTVGDTGNGDGLIEPGESARLTLQAAFEPRQDQVGGGFAGTDYYDILGDESWATGVIDTHWNLLDPLGFGPGEVNDTNDILDVMHYQLPLMFNEFRPDNPVDTFYLEWTPDGYSPRSVTLDNGGPDAWIYTDYQGHSMPYTGTGGAVTFSIVPSPAATALLALGALAARRRR